MGPIKPSVAGKSNVNLEPFDTGGVDFLGPKTPIMISVRGNRYIVIKKDHFTRFLFARAVCVVTGLEPWKLFEWTTNTIGGPLAAYTNNRHQFLSEELHGMLSKWGINQISAPKTHPSSVRLVARYVQLVMCILRRRVPGNNKEIRDILRATAEQTLNTRGIKVHRYTPSERLVGYHPMSGPMGDITADILMDAIDAIAYGIYLARLD